MSNDRLRLIVAQLKPHMQCNCDLDNWEPEQTTGHSWVCRIHRAAIEELRFGRNRLLHKEE